MPIDGIESDILKISEHASELLRLQVSGVDVIFDDHTKKAYLLEINNAPQVMSGSFVEEKASLYANMIRLILGGN